MHNVRVVGQIRYNENVSNVTFFQKALELKSILSLFRNEFNKFNNTRARMLHSIYHMTLR